LCFLSNYVALHLYRIVNLITVIKDVEIMIHAFHDYRI
jgi:hypothetical protein